MRSRSAAGAPEDPRRAPRTGSFPPPMRAGNGGKAGDEGPPGAGQDWRVPMTPATEASPRPARTSPISPAMRAVAFGS